MNVYIFMSYLPWFGTWFWPHKLIVAIEVMTNRTTFKKATQNDMTKPA